MGILNITPNSFSDGGEYLNCESACARALDMVNQGADIIDIGGEATNPGAESISVDEELSRVIPVIRAIRQQSDVSISIDSSKAAVMREAIDAGASIINDIKALTGAGSMDVAKKYDVPICLMHMSGSPSNMQNRPHYDDLLQEINDFFIARINDCISHGIKRERLILDPGFGFGKTVLHNLLLLKNISCFVSHQLPLLIGVSRKSTIGAVVNKEKLERMPASLAATVYSILNGVSIVRTHDVAQTQQALCMVKKILEAA